MKTSGQAVITEAYPLNDSLLSSEQIHSICRLVTDSHVKCVISITTRIQLLDTQVCLMEEILLVAGD